MSRNKIWFNLIWYNLKSATLGRVYFYCFLFYPRTRISEVLTTKVYKVWLETDICFDANDTCEHSILLDGHVLYALPCDWTSDFNQGMYYCLLKFDRYSITYELIVLYILAQTSFAKSIVLE